MASNRTLIRGRQFACVPTSGGVNSGDPALYGALPCVSLNGQTLVAGVASSTTPQTVDTLGVYNLFVRGRKAGANAALNASDPVYFTPAGHTYTPGSDSPLSGDSSETNAVPYGVILGKAVGPGGSGTFGGYASGVAVASGALAAVDVRLRGSAQ